MVYIFLSFTSYTSSLYVASIINFKFFVSASSTPFPSYLPREVKKSLLFSQALGRE